MGEAMVGFSLDDLLIREERRTFLTSELQEVGEDQTVVDLIRCALALLAIGRDQSVESGVTSCELHHPFKREAPVGVALDKFLEAAQDDLMAPCSVANAPIFRTDLWCASNNTACPEKDTPKTSEDISRMWVLCVQSTSPYLCSAQSLTPQTAKRPFA